MASEEVANVLATVEGEPIDNTAVWYLIEAVTTDGAGQGYVSAAFTVCAG